MYSTHAGLFVPVSSVGGFGRSYTISIISVAWCALLTSTHPCCLVLQVADTESWYLQVAILLVLLYLFHQTNMMPDIVNATLQGGGRQDTGNLFNHSDLDD